MAARYVNPDNITAQGQYFYTGLPPGSYDTGGGRASNVYGAGSGGSAGVSPDYTGADAGKSWQYPASFDLKLPVWDKGDGMGDGGGTQGPPGTPNPNPNPPVSPGRRKGKLPQQWHKVTMKPSNTEASREAKRQRNEKGRQKTVNARLGESILEADRVRTPAAGGEEGTREYAELPPEVVNAGTEFPMESGGSIRTDLEFMRHPKPAAVAASNAGSHGMWGKGDIQEGPLTHPRGNAPPPTQPGWESSAGTYDTKTGEATGHTPFHPGGELKKTWELANERVAATRSQSRPPTF